MIDYFAIRGGLNMNLQSVTFTPEWIVRVLNSAAWNWDILNSAYSTTMKFLATKRLRFFFASSSLFSFNRHYHRTTNHSSSTQRPWTTIAGQLSPSRHLVHLCLTMTKICLLHHCPFFFFKWDGIKYRLSGTRTMDMDLV
jgi:hypothetical protein